MSLVEVAALERVRTGRYADAAVAIAWLVGLSAVGAGFWWERAVRESVVGAAPGVTFGLVAAGVCLGLVATSVPHAVSSGAAFGLTVVVLGALWGLLTGSVPALVGAGGAVTLPLSALLVLAVPSAVAPAVRAVL